MAKMNRFKMSFELKVTDYADKTGNRATLFFLIVKMFVRLEKARELDKSMHEVFLIMYLLKSFDQVSQFAQLFIILALIV
jgi:hypothetical protein